MEKWTFAIALLAFLLAAARWLLDWWAGTLPWRQRGGRHERIALRVEFLASGTNCFIIRGGYTLVCVSLRVYNRSEQRAATLSRVVVQVKFGRRWRRLEPHPAEEAAIFGSLIRNALPLELPPGGEEDLFEIYQLPDLIARTTARIRVRVSDYSGAHASVEDLLSLRLDDRPPLDILFQTLEIRSKADYAQ